MRGDLLRQERAGLNLAAAATYKREGFGGSAGEVEGTLAASHTFSALEAGGALTFGHALDRGEGDAELALHATRSLGKGFSAGLDMRGRARLGEDCGDDPDACAGDEGDADADHAADWAGGPVLAWSRGPAMILIVPGAQIVAGPTGVQSRATAMASVGIGFQASSPSTGPSPSALMKRAVASRGVWGSIGTSTTALGIAHPSR